MRAFVSIIATLCLLSAAHAQTNQPRPEVRTRSAQRTPSSGPNQRLVQYLCRPSVARKVGVSPETVARIKQQLEAIAVQERPIREELDKKFRANVRLAKKILSSRDEKPEALIAATEAISALHAKLALLDIQKLLVLRDNLTPEQSECLLKCIREERRMPTKRPAKGIPPTHDTK
ncbi:MAG: hypothetical protein SPK06_04305 [Kiritimatiellia bacterium]|nr:hypothetical protein [Kiritimatiellia bacterium]